MVIPPLPDHYVETEIHDVGRTEMWNSFQATLCIPEDLKTRLKFFLKQACCMITDTEDGKHLKTSFIATHTSSPEITHNFAWTHLDRVQ